VGRGARARAAALGRHAESHPAAGCAPHDPAIRQPVDHTTQEHIPRVYHRRAGLALQRYPDHR
jgi:hypothetical protein